MKKIIKSLTMLCFALVLCVPMFMLAGCTKNYTITVSVEAGKGSVYKAKEDNGQENLLGKNTVRGGEKFEYYVVPATGYEIDKVVVDGEEVEITNITGTYFYIEEVDKNHTIQAYFKEKIYTVTFQCSDGNELFLQKNYKFNSIIDFNAKEFGGNNNDFWYVVNSKNVQISIKTEYNNRISVSGALTIKTSKTKAELDAIIAAL